MNSSWQKPRARTEYIDMMGLLERAKLGKYELPPIKRSTPTGAKKSKARAQQWSIDDRIRLFDSIYRGYPIGTILLWEPIKPQHGSNRFGPFEATVRDEAPWIVIDGQERLTTLFGGLLVPPSADAPAPEWAIAFDARAKCFVALPMDPAPELFPLPFAVDTKRMLKWVRKLPPPAHRELVPIVDECSAALRTYRIPVHVLPTDDRALLEDAYARMNIKSSSQDSKTMFDALFEKKSQERWIVKLRR